MRSIFLLSGAGCFLPALILANFVFGWIFLKPLYWLVSEAVLISLFVINSRIISGRINSALVKRSNVIDVEAEAVKESPKKIKEIS